MPNPYTDILKETPLLSLEDRYPHLAGMKPRVDHRGDPAYEHLRVRLEPVPPTAHRCGVTSIAHRGPKPMQTAQ